MSRDNTEVQFLAFLQVIYGEQQTNGIGSARDRNDDRFTSIRQVQSAPFGDQVAYEIVHAVSLATNHTNCTNVRVFQKRFSIFTGEGLFRGGKRGPLL
jgi:hypothetical protein